MKTLNTTQTTMIQQVRSLGLKFQEVIIIDENSLRFHRRRRSGYRSVNVDVTYIVGLDLYSVEVHETSMDGKTFEITTETKKFDGVYFDQLDKVWGS